MCYIPSILKPYSSYVWRTDQKVILGIKILRIDFFKGTINLRELKGAACVCLLLRPSEVRLLEKMRLNCQVFKDEIALVHLNRQVAHLHEVLEKTQAKVSLEPPI